MSPKVGVFHTVYIGGYFTSHATGGAIRMKASLQIIYEGDYGRPLTAATVLDRQLLVHAAEAAIAEAHRKADAVADVDDFLGTLQHEDAARLAKVLGMLIPELGTPAVRMVKKRKTPERFPNLSGVSR
jgi:hypothetical protein